MQKVNITGIVVRHLKSLRDNEDKLLWSDVAVFYSLPVLIGVVMYVACGSIPKDAIGLSISVFSIFAALLLSVQVALYSVSLRPLSPPTDPKKTKLFDVISSGRGKMIRELSDNISYLILLAVVFITILLAMFALNWQDGVASAVAVTLYAHFFLTLLMVVKRSSIVFSREYEH